MKHLEFKNLNLDDCIKVLEGEEARSTKPRIDLELEIRQRTGRGASGR